MRLSGQVSVFKGKQLSILSDFKNLSQLAKFTNITCESVIGQHHLYKLFENTLTWPENLISIK